MKTYMMDIDVEKVKADIRKQMTLTDMACLLKPYIEVPSDAYHSFKYWLKVGRMPRVKYKQMMEILNEKGS